MATIPTEPRTQRPLAVPLAPAPEPGLTKRRVLLWCTWCAPVFTLLLFGGMILADLLPPPSMDLSAEQIAAHYAQDTDLKRLGLLLLMVGGALTGPLVVAISDQLKRIPGAGPLSQLQLISGALGVAAIVIPTCMFIAAAFRPERDPQITQALHDLAMLPFIMNFVPACLQCGAIGLAILMQKGPKPLFGRWVGYFNLWAAFLFLPGALIVFFRDGAFAIDGLITFWAVAVIFGSWFYVMFFALRKAIRTDTA